MSPCLHAFWLQAALAHGRSRGFTEARMLEICELDEAAVAEPLSLVPLRSHYALLEWLESETGGPQVALEIGGSLGYDWMGAAGFLPGTAPTLREGITKFVAFLPAAGERYWLACEGERARLHLQHHGETRRAHALRAASFATDLGLHAALFVDGGFTDLRIELKTDDEELIEALRDRLGVPVQGQLAHDAVSFAALDLERAPRDANPALHAFFDDYLGPHRPAPHEDAASRLGRVIDARLPDRPIDRHSLAKACGWSPRTLQRRLAEQGTTLRRVLRERRLARARRVLDAGGSMSEAAFESGYSEASALHRALRRER